MERDKDELNRNIQHLENKLAELGKDHEDLGIKKDKLQQQYDMFKGQTAEKLQDMKEVMDGEKATGKSWKDRAENYSRENVVMSSRVMEADHKSANLTANVETLRAKLEAANDDIHDLTREGTKNRDEIEELKRKREDLDRELTSVKEVMEQREVSKTDLVSKL